MIVPRAPRAIASMAMWFVQTSSESQFARASLPSTLTPRASRASYSIALPSPTYAIGPVSPPAGVGGTPPWLAAGRSRRAPAPNPSGARADLGDVLDDRPHVCRVESRGDRVSGQPRARGRRGHEDDGRQY